jgi:hypothetical protein
MIGPDQLARVSAEAVVPEQVVSYVRAVAGSRPRMIGACVGYESDETLVLVGYPLHNPQDTGAMADAVNQALETPGLNRLTVLGPARPPQAPAGIQALEDAYFALPVPAPPPNQKLRNILRRAGRELRLDRGRHLGDDHLALVQCYLNDRRLAPGTRHIFRQLARYIEASDRSMIVSARFADGRLAAFTVGEFASFTTGFFMFCFRNSGLAPPGSADLALSGLLEAAHECGQTRMNLGLGINPGIRFFKRKWGADLFLPYVEVSWAPRRQVLFSRLRAMLRRNSP